MYVYNVSGLPERAKGIFANIQPVAILVLMP
jgi:hypothetical protein